MAKLSFLFVAGMLCCILEQAYSNYYINYPNSAGLMSYYQPYLPYGYAPYAVAAPADCDKKEGGGEGSSSSSSESSSSESSSSESKEGGSSEEKEGGSSESKESGESKEGGEGGESKEESSSSSSEESKEGGEEKKEKKKEKPEKPLFPPPTYTFPQRPVQQVVYSAQPYPYMPYRTYSVVQQAPVSYPVKSSYYSVSGVPITAAYSGSVVRSYVPQVARVVASPVSKIVSVPTVSKSYGINPTSNIIGASSYWAPAGNVGYYKA